MPILNIEEQIWGTPVLVSVVTAMIAFYIRKTSKYCHSHRKRDVEKKM